LSLVSDIKKHSAESLLPSPTPYSPHPDQNVRNCSSFGSIAATFMRLVVPSQ
jgi:hypothetical protein